MISDRQQAYLDAIGIEVWSLRESASPSPSPSPSLSPPPTPSVVASLNASTPRLRIGTGGGGILLICAADVDSAGRLANDISRSLGNVPVWAWPDDEPTAIDLDSAVDEKLFTTVAVFGSDLAGQFFDGDLPTAVSSAKLVLLPSMRDIQTKPEARQSLWASFCRSGMVSKREHQT
jgi:hypothetical protein